MSKSLPVSHSLTALDLPRKGSFESFYVFTCVAPIVVGYQRGQQYSRMLRSANHVFVECHINIVQESLNLKTLNNIGPCRHHSGFLQHVVVPGEIR